MKNLLIAGVVSLVLAGCSTTPVNPQSAASVPGERIYKHEYFSQQGSGSARVTFLRDKGFLGGGCSHDMYVNNIKAFSIRPNEKAVIHLEPDYYIFRLETGGGLCPNIATSQEAELKPNADAEYRILLPSDTSLRLTRIK